MKSKRVGVALAVSSMAFALLIASSSQAQEPQSPPPVTITVSESIGVSDGVGAVPPAQIGVAEGVAVGDAVAVVPPATITVPEGIGVTDAVSVVPPAILTVAEGIGVSDSVLAEVINSPPTVDAGGPYTVDEGGSVSVSATGSDPDGQQLSYAWDLDNNGSFEAPGQSATFSAASLDGPSSRTIKVRGTDTGGLTAEATATVNVLNQPPTATFNAPASVDEGSAIGLSLTGASDPSSADTAAGFTYAFDCGSGFGSFGSSNGASCSTSDNGSRTVRGRIRDKDGGVSEYQAVIQVENVAPSVGSITAPTDPLQVGTTVNASVPFSDPGTADAHTAVWDWGDGQTSPGTVTEGGGAGSASASHIYTTPGVYTIEVTVTDDEGAWAASAFQFVVIYDPAGGFVTGGGWIDSPLGAYAADPSLMGKATFGFVSKYFKGATTPSGNTEFQFKAGSLNFKSTSYDWLVIAGGKAKFKGSGEINGVGGYRFLLSAIDGQKSGDGGADRFRMKIWDTITETLVYDNQLGAAEDADPTTVIGGGSIVVHK